MQDANGNVLLADQAQLSGDLTEGILTSARLVLANRFSLLPPNCAAARAGSIRSGSGGGIVVQCLRRSTAPVGNPRRSVLHDVAGQQLYFSGAQLRFAGVPVFYLRACACRTRRWTAHQGF